MNKILIIDDEKDIREILTEALENNNFEVARAEDGVEGIKLAFQLNPDLILCDTAMPKMNGHEVLRMLRKNPATSGTPFIFLTAKSEKTDVRQGMLSGADDYLTKPFTLHEVLAAIHIRLDRRSEIEQSTLAKKIPGSGRLEQALQQSEFILHFQPQVSLKTRKVTGAEALIRWQHPEKGLLGPEHVIPLAEQTGLIISLGQWIIRTACQQLKIWHQAGFTDLRISVNVSTLQIEQPNFYDTIINILANAGLDPCFLEIELTESVIVKTTDLINNTILRLRSAGIFIAIDDFGIGYSSLSYLKKFSFDTLKIDRMFVQEIPKDESNVALVFAIMQPAKSFNLNVIAEGVETDAEYEFLRKNGCQEAQGYLISRPLSVNEFSHFLLKTLCDRGETFSPA